MNGAALSFDLVVIGGGSGGLAAAFRAAEHGARVALLESGELGGTCVNVGCVPKKAMWLAAYLAQRMELARGFGFGVEPGPPDWPRLVASRQGYIAGIHASYRRRLDAAGVVSLPSRGRLIDPHLVETADGTRLQGRHVLIATGGRPHRPDIPGAALGLVSDDFFQLCAAPARVAVVGGGYIGVELSGILQALGSRVEMFVRGPCLLDGFDGELSAVLEGNMHQDGIAIHAGYQLAGLVADADRDTDGHGVRMHEAGGDPGGRFDAVLFATGRVANSGGLGLEALGVATDARGRILVDDWQSTSVAGLHAVGDVTDRIGLTPVAIAAARRLMDRLFGGCADAKLDYRDVPTVVFAHPPLASVGLTEAAARALHGAGDVHCHRAQFRPMLHALADSNRRSLFKLVCVGVERRVVGLHLLGEGADEILQGFAVALKRGITLADLHDTIALHPTSAEEVVLMP
ncbi:MAG TPA: glutathione-disulfide reductase [Luteimonas sp.]|nr:glutathione-disulfide reductase [Luteimonas sp.]